MSAHPANPSLRRPSSLRGTLTAPGDKSVSHRSLLLNALGIGRARVTNFVPSADCLSTMRCLQALGVTIERHDDGSLTVEGRGRAALAEAADVLDCGNSGTTLRLLAGVLAGCPFFSVLTGDASLRSRPMGRIVAPLTAMGARIGGRADDSRAPLAIRGGALQGIEWRLPVSSAQIKSAVLLAGLAASGPTTALSPEPSRDHTERMLRAMGADLRGDGVAVTVHPATAPLRAVDVVVPGDVSSAAYWLAAGCAHPDAEITVRDVGVNPTRTGLLDVLAEMGARIERTNEREVAGEPIADLTA
ncbi:MAG: 3-phosphoshikimate 1-carboxyvinyltransferase, partial [Chloroflexi bacterium]|nr:3-phosphoshikimate 1-carboxyvinyltransferase [Chloroflexota bacterium]